MWHIPYTAEYLAYLGASIADAVSHTGIDGFMTDLVWNPDCAVTDGRWLPCEQQLYPQLMNAPFPGEADLTAAQEVEYGRKAIDCCWGVIRDAAKGANSDCIVWLCCNDLNHAHARNSRMFHEADWLMNEHPNPATLPLVRAAAGPDSAVPVRLGRRKRRRPGRE